MVQMLLQTPGIRLFDFAQADAYTRRFGFLSPGRRCRAAWSTWRATCRRTTCAWSRRPRRWSRADALHPALAQLFVQAAQQVHGDAGLVPAQGRLSERARQRAPLSRRGAALLPQGAPLLQRYLPFWLANLIDRMWVVLLSIVAVLIPLSRVVPPLVEFRIRSRIFRWYGQLRAIEEAQRPQRRATSC